METGVTRKIDELGRIVIPKEIRRNLSIRDGENLEICIVNDNIVLKKYSSLSKYVKLCDMLCNEVSSVYNVDIAISDRERIIASSNNELVGKVLDDEQLKLVDNRVSFGGNGKVIEPVVVDSDSLGLVIVYGNDGVMNLCKIIAQILTKLIEI